jgi:hypothetical protein
LAVVNYLEHHGHYPPAWIADKNGKPLLSWRVLILPYLDGQELYEQFDLTEPWDGPNNSKLLDQMPSPYRLHTIKDQHKTATNYVAVVGENTLWQGAEPRSPNFVKDGESNTLLVAEYVGHPIPWTKPEDLLFDKMDLAVDSDKGICSVLTPPAFVAADGMVRYLPTTTPPDTVRALLTAQADDNDKFPPGRQFPSIHDGRQRPRKDAR